MNSTNIRNVLLQIEKGDEREGGRYRAIVVKDALQPEDRQDLYETPPQISRSLAIDKARDWIDRHGYRLVA